MYRSFIAGIACSLLLALQACAPASTAPAPRTSPVVSYAPPVTGEEFVYAPSGVKQGYKLSAAKQNSLRPMMMSEKDMKKSLIAPE